MIGCKGICKTFKGYRGGSGKNMYKDPDGVFCKRCHCGFISDSIYCPCCRARVRHQTWVGVRRKTRLETTPRIE